MRIGIDVGGTHTDGVLVEAGELKNVVKKETDSENLLETLTDVLKLLTADISSKEVQQITLSTTLSTNAVVTGHTEDVGMFVIPGPGISAEAYRVGSFYEILDGAIDHRGKCTAPLDRAAVRKICASYRAENVRSFGITGKFSPRNPLHEQQIFAAIEDQSDFVSLGHQLSDQCNFGRRIHTVYYNSAVWRLSTNFAKAFLQSAAALGLQAPVRIVKADGGTMSLQQACNQPVQGIFSGPAASVMGVLAMLPESEDALILDVGGTTTDIAALFGGMPLLEKEGAVLAGKPTLVRALKMSSVALGGDSVLRVQGGQICVGPERLGPCLALGGPAPTFMDAVNAAGYADFGDKRRSLKGLTQQADSAGFLLDDYVHQALHCGLDVLSRALGDYVATINEKPVYTIQEVLEKRCFTPQRVYLLGGPAKALRPLLQTQVDIPVIVPEHAATANAVGAAGTRPTQSLALFADTAQGMLTVPALGLQKEVKRGYSLEHAVHDALGFLRKELAKEGIAATAEDLQITQADCFTMVEGFSTLGHNIRVRCQLCPGVSTFKV